MASALAGLPSLQVREHPTKGRGVYVAEKEGIPAGTTLFVEVPFSSVVLTSASQRLCGRCLAEADPDICCDDCSDVMYCSEECQDEMANLHSLECEVLEDIDLIVKKSNADRDLLRLLIRILCTRAIGSAHGNASNALKTTYDDVLAMVHATTKMNDEWIASVERGAAQLQKALPSQCAVSVSEIVGLAARVNENSYSLEARSTTTNTGVASVGLFPVAGLINHSCAPNTTWSLASGEHGCALVMRATEFIPHDKEVTVTYIDVNQPRAARQKELLETKHFECTCDRCQTQLPDSIDAIVDGCQCASPCHGLLAFDSKSSTFICAACHRVHQNAEVRGKLTSSSNALKSAEAKYNKKQYREAKLDLINFCASNDPSTPQVVLHPSNYLLTNALRILADCCYKLNEHAECYKHRLLALERLKATLATWSPLLATAHFDLADVISVGLKHNIWSGDDKVAKLGEMKSNYQHCLNIRLICYEDSHSSVGQVKKILEAL